ncbi:S49 family peptidase [Luteolibacter flavescens]|uniref:S49 family peptidase n=1 Tax=Luteolibacter flavescens TaxID=1859460 RepID=A0ABT3FTY9_9BACT|nr:S49 family peptidase [Luteolibacter flavescens]MCW1887056.1 S49 family peptidase [Luteolibacter flavescens]
MKTTIAISLLAALPLAAAEEKPVVAIYDLEGTISESGRPEASLLGLDMEATRPLTLFDLTRSLKKAAADPNVKAVVVDTDDAQLGLPQLQEIHRRLQEVRAAGKDVWLYTDSLGNGTALLGSAANHFTLMPEGDVSFSGIYSESMYFKGLLDKAGVVADVIHIGDFKSFGEEYYRTGPSDFAKQQKEELIGGIFDQLVGEISEGRKVPAEKIRELVDRGTFTPAQAKEAGLVDDLKHRTDFSAAVKAAYEGAKFDRGYELPDQDGPEITGMLDIFKLMFESDKSKNAKTDYIAVVPFEGEISSESIAPIRTQILKLLKDDRAKALVLRVDSPGGSALASEVLWEATDEWKASGRPFVVSMGGVAASGGYYISSGADRIFAEEGTVTGSIGVVGMKLVLGGAMEKLGITTHATQRGKNAGAQSMVHPFSEEESKLVRDSMLQVYGTFKKRIEAGRGDRLKGELEGMAGGRVFTGKRALELGLVDELGGLGEAVAYAADKSGVNADALKLVPEPKSPLEGLFAKPEKPADDEIVKMGVRVSPVAEAVKATLGDAQINALPKPARDAVTRVLKRIETCSDSTIQLVGPEISIPLK